MCYRAEFLSSSSKSSFSSISLRLRWLSKLKGFGLTSWLLLTKFAREAALLIKCCFYFSFSASSPYIFTTSFSSASTYISISSSYFCLLWIVSRLAFSFSSCLLTSSSLRLVCWRFRFRALSRKRMLTWGRFSKSSTSGRLTGSTCSIQLMTRINSSE